MTLSMIATADGVGCWNTIGTSGDRSCPELEVYTHCRNCPVFANAARDFFRRPAPEGYLDEWAAVLAEPVEPRATKDVSLLIFRLRAEWLAFQARSVVEVTTPRPVHRIPHRSNETLVGMVNLRGRLQLQVSLHGLLGVGEGERDAGKGTPRLVVISREGSTWVFQADEVLGVHRFPRARLGAVPSTLANPETSFSHAVIDWKGHSVGYLDDQRVFDALEGVCHP